MTFITVRHEILWFHRLGVSNGKEGILFPCCFVFPLLAKLLVLSVRNMQSVYLWSIFLITKVFEAVEQFG